MKKHFILSLLFSVWFSVHAQPSKEQRIQDSVIGWWSNTRFDRFVKPTNDPVQKRRIQIDDSIVSWVKKSYTPVAGLGTYVRQLNKNWYGVSFDVWNVSHDKMWTDEKGQFKPISEENTTFALQVNTLPSVVPIDFLNHYDAYYFTWEPDGYMTEQTAQRRKGYEFKNHPNVKQFITRITNGQNCVILSPGNKSPFVEVTIGEFLDKAEESLEKEKQKERERVNNTFSGSHAGAIKNREDVWAQKEKQFQICLSRINKWRLAYKNKLSQPATFDANQQTLLLAFNSDNVDPFEVREIELSRKQYKSVYKIPAEVSVKCKTDQPQWITAWWPFNGANDGTQLYEMSTAMLENINYSYIYNYFFAPEKVKGISYKPANEEQLKARLATYRNKYRSGAVEVVNKKQTPSGTFFFEDFSGGSVGTAPPNWYYFKTGTSPFAITKPEGLEGNWLKLGFGRKISSTYLKSSVPQNFKLEFDVATDKDFSGRSGGSMELILNTEKLNQTNQNQEERLFNNGTVMKITVASGNDADLENNNFRGLLKVNINSSPAINRENFEEGITAEKPLRDFSSKKNKVHITLLVKDGKVSVFSNGNLIIQPADFKMKYGGPCQLCGIPNGRSFASLTLNNITNNDKETGVYISNIKIVKE
ncbi:hypothetical protein [Lacibacter sediminis]|uniref:Uncharacterized protein n=1 Tax=Lacibacter sediminis TaxID=2760713 RepID=A0A7G5XLN4_9BACT|nr:hypothetical protein [Lacibacter sediminis]QNA46387.1 hypothetical protein H4075_09510 [Lacibacter sediminis]